MAAHDAPNQCAAHGDRTIDVYNTHFDWGEAFLRGSAMLFRRWVAESPPGAGLVVTGDFNVDAAHPFRRALTEVPFDGGRRLRDAVEAWGAAAAHPTRHDFTGGASDRIDWILASSDLAVPDAGTDTGTHGGRCGRILHGVAPPSWIQHPELTGSR